MYYVFQKQMKDTNAQALSRTVSVPVTWSDFNFPLCNIGSHRLTTKYVTVNLKKRY